MRDGQITAQDVGIAYRLYREKVSTLKEAVANRFRHLRGAETFWALRFGKVVDRFGMPWLINCEKHPT